MAKNLANIHIYGEDASAVFVGALGTTAPVALAAPATPIRDVGWLSEDGIDIDRKAEIKRFKAHQGAKVVKVKVTGTENSFKFQCLEETALVLGLMHAGSTGVTTTGITTVTVPGGMSSDPRMWIIDEYEGTTQARWVFPNGTVGDRGTIAYKSDEMTVYEFTVDVVGDFTYITNSPSVVYPIV
jgi:hypothetical protein